MHDTADLGLLNRWQRGFPLVARPFGEIGAREGRSEEAVIEAFRALRAAGALARIGALFRPNTVGASMLAAMRVPGEALERVAAQVSARPEVNHNYERANALNLWFVATARDAQALEAAIRGIERDTGLGVLRLPLVEEYHIDLGFDLGVEAGTDPVAQRGSGAAPGRVVLGAAGQRLVEALADGLPFAPRPYAALGRACGLREGEVIDLLRGWLAQGVVRRFGAVARHRRLGYHANAMVVWDLPDDAAAAAGGRLAADAAVTLCYRRERRPPDWPYNLYCMVHGREHATVLGQVERLTAAAGLGAWPRQILFSERCFTQRGARYAAAA